MYIFNSSSLDRDLVIECGVVSSTLLVMAQRHVCVRNLVDSASSHMLVSKIKPCKCKFTTLSENGMCTGKLRTAHYNRIRLT